MLVLKNCRFVPFLTEGVDLVQGDMLIEGDKIARIAPAGTDFGTDAEVMDLGGKTLLPGLIDMHVHLFCRNFTEMIDKEKGLPRPIWTFNALSYAKELLNAGYTTVRDVGDNTTYPAIFLRDAIKAGRFTGPNLVCSGPIVESTYTTVSSLNEICDGPVEWRKACRKMFMMGADFIKIYSSGSLLIMSNKPGFPIVDLEEVKSAVQVAKRYGSYVSAHSHGATAIAQCIEAGVHTIEHASLITEESLRRIEEENLDIGLVPTLYAFYDAMEQDTPIGKRATALSGKIMECLKNAYSHKDILMGWGTDAEQDSYTKDPMKEFRLRKELLDISNEDLLKQATINSAKLMYMDDRIGTIQESKLADLIAVEGDPVADISVLYDLPAHVIKSGKVVR